MIKEEDKKQAECRNCGKKLRGTAYMYGGDAYIPLEDGGGRAPANFCGGYVCSYSCDYNACLALEQTMPGHSYNQKRIGSSAAQWTEDNWK